MSTPHFFESLIILHILSGAPGLFTFWVPVLVKKGGERHKFWGRLFTIAMLFTASVAALMAITTLVAPMITHPHLQTHSEFSDPALVRGIFGWMMLYLAILTINLAWYGWRCIANRNDHGKNRHWFNLALQGALAVAAVNCAVQGLMINQLMMVGISFVGFATVATNLWFILRSSPGPLEWLLEHIKGIVGTGISVYTAFFAFGAVRFVPELALAPALWAVPLTVGLGLILYHQQKVRGRARPGRGSLMTQRKTGAPSSSPLVGTPKS